VLFSVSIDEELALKSPPDATIDALPEPEVAGSGER
jgi:hypothetical protein